MNGVKTSNEFKTLLADGTLIRNIAACKPDVNTVLDQVQRDYRSDSEDPAEARLQEWAVVRAIGEIRDSFLLMASAHESYGEQEPESDDDFND